MSHNRIILISLFSFSDETIKTKNKKKMMMSFLQKKMKIKIFEFAHITDFKTVSIHTYVVKSFFK